MQEKQDEARTIATRALQLGLLDEATLRVQMNDYNNYLQSGGSESFGKLLVHRQLINPQQMQRLQFELTTHSPFIATPAPTPSSRSRSGSNISGRQGSKNLAPGSTLIPGFTIVKVLGEGGMGIVYEATDQHGRAVALKLIRGELASERAKKRFVREQEVMQKLRHPNIVTITGAGTSSYGDYIAMELLSGKALDAVQSEQELTSSQALEIIVKMCKGVAFAHEKDIVHRDLKPSNIMITDDNDVKVMDFGLAKDLNRETMLTRESAVLGTPHYLSPEQAMGEHNLLGPHSDVFSIGVMMYEMLAGQRPFQADTAAALYHRIATYDPPPIQSVNPELPPTLAAICHKALRKEPHTRYSNAKELSEDIERVLAGERFAVESKVTLAKRWAKRRPVLAATLSLVLILLFTTPYLIHVFQQNQLGQERAVAGRELKTRLTKSAGRLKKALEKKDNSLESELDLALAVEADIAIFAEQSDAIAASLTELLQKPRYMKLRVNALIARSERRLKKNEFTDALSDAQLALDQLKKNSPFFNRALELAALAEYESGQGKEALKRLEVAPDAPFLAPLRARLYEDLGDMTKALSALEKAIEKNPNPVILAEKARLLAQNGRKKESETLFQRLLRDNRKSRRITLIRVQSLEAEERFADATKLLAKALRIAPKDLFLCRERTRLLSLQGRYADALSELSQTIQFNSGLLSLHVERALIHLDLGQTTAARNDLTKARGKTRSDEEVIAVSLATAKLLIMEGESFGARKEANKLLALFPTNPDICRLMAQFKYKGPGFQEALNKLLRVSPRDFWGLSQAARNAIEKRDIDTAERFYKQLQRRFPGRSETLLVKAHLYQLKKQTELARETLLNHAKLRNSQVGRGIDRVGLAKRLLALTAPEVRKRGVALLRLAFFEQPEDSETLCLVAQHLPELTQNERVQEMQRALKNNKYCENAQIFIATWRGKSPFKTALVLECIERLLKTQPNAALRVSLLQGKIFTLARAKQWTRAERSLADLEAKEKKRFIPVRLELAQMQNFEQRSNLLQKEEQLRRARLAQIYLQAKKLLTKDFNLNEAFSSQEVDQAKKLLAVGEKLSYDRRLLRPLWAKCYLAESNGFVG
ncbi:MAG: protein kinase, partial [Planctomycetota bacterium]|nr:protein kinase [Planctomycetota bacterium]